MWAVDRPPASTSTSPHSVRAPAANLPLHLWQLEHYSLHDVTLLIVASYFFPGYKQNRLGFTLGVGLLSQAILLASAWLSQAEQLWLILLGICMEWDPSGLLKLLSHLEFSLEKMREARRFKIVRLLTHSLARSFAYCTCNFIIVSVSFFLSSFWVRLYMQS